jgi:hypothetical protein
VDEDTAAVVHQALGERGPEDDDGLHPDPQPALGFELEGEGWRERLRNWAIVQRGLETVDDTGLDDQDKLRIIGLISSYTLSESRMAHEAARAAAQAPDDAAARWTFEGLLRELIDAEGYPRLHRIATAADTDEVPSPDHERQEFLFGLDRILDGVESLIERAAGGSPG